MDTIDDQALFQMARSLREEGNIVQAISCLKKLLDFHPSDVYVLVEMADILRFDGQYVQAKPLYSHVQALSPGSPEGYYGLGQCFQEEGNFEGAKALYLQSIEKCIDWTPGYLGMVSCFLYFNDIELARIWAERAILLHSHLDVAYNMLAVVRWKLQDFVGAKLAAYKSVEYNDRYAMPFLLLAMLPSEAFEDGEAFGQPYFNRALVILNLQNVGRHVLKDFLSYLLSLDAPMLVCNFLARFDLVEPEGFSILPEISRILIDTEPCRKQIQLLSSENDWSDSSLILEALLNFHLGDPGKAFHILKDIIDRFKTTSPQVLYYYCLSAKLILHPELQTIYSRCLQQVFALTHPSLKNDNDQYYLGLLLVVTQRVDKARLTFEELSDRGFFCADLQLASLNHEDYSDFSRFEADIIAPLFINLQGEQSYFNDPSAICLSGKPGQMLIDLQPLIFYMENSDVLGMIDAYAQSYSYHQHYDPMGATDFLRKVAFDNVHSGRVWNYIKKYNPVLISKFEETKKGIGDLSAKVLYYASLPSPAAQVAAEIHSSFYAAYDYIVRNHDSPPKLINYSEYVVIMIALVQSQAISNQDCTFLYQYMAYCQSVLKSASTEFGIGKLTLDMALEKLPVLVLQGMSIGWSSVLSIFELLRKFVRKDRSPIISFAEFKKVITSRLLANG